MNRDQLLESLASVCYLTTSHNLNAKLKFIGKNKNKLQIILKNKKR